MAGGALLLAALGFVAPAVLSPALAAGPEKIEVTGKASVVTGVIERDGVTDARADADAEIAVKGSTVLRNGIELGAVVEGRFDNQQPGRLYGGGRYSSLLIGGPRGVAPLTGGAYLQGAYAYARGGFGQVIIGRDHGVGRTFAVTAPTIFRAINANDWRTDFTGFNDVHTVNDFSGYATKITYLPPANFLGGVLGGLQLGVSYTPSLGNCGDGLCQPADRLLLSPDGLLLNETARWDDVLEAALYYQKEINFGRNGLLVGLGASYVTADEDARAFAPLLADYHALSVGLNLGYRGITVGGSVKTTNAGLAEADRDGYLAFDAGVAFKTGETKGDWGVMFGYGQSEATVIGPNPANPFIFRDTQVAQAGVTYFVGRGITIGAAAQYTETNRPAAIGGPQEATTVVLESSIKF